MHVTQAGEYVRKQMMFREEGRYDKAGVPEGPDEQPVFTVKTIFINLATCPHSALRCFSSSLIQKRFVLFHLQPPLIHLQSVKLFLKVMAFLAVLTCPVPNGFRPSEERNSQLFINNHLEGS